MAVLSPGACSGAPVAFTAACTGCGACLLTCPTHAIRPRVGLDPPGSPGRPRVPAALYALEELCTACGECVEVCPADAIRLLPLRPAPRDGSGCGRRAAGGGAP